MRNKRGFIRILEATIGVLLVTSVLLVVYINQQPVQFGGSQDFIYNLQRQMLLDISSRSDLRADVLNGEPNTEIDNYLEVKIPDAFGYYLAVCNLNETGVCKLDATNLIATRERNVFAEETIVAADLGAGLYEPKKVRLFMWENG